MFGDDIRQSLRHSKTVEFLLQNAVIKEAAKS